MQKWHIDEQAGLAGRFFRSENHSVFNKKMNTMNRATNEMIVDYSYIELKQPNINN